MNGVKFPGLEVDLGGVKYTMPPLNAKAAKVWWPRLLALQTGQESDVLDLGVGVALACLQRNYPDLARETIEEFVDLDNVEELIAKAGGAGSFRRWTQQQLALQAAQGNEMPQTLPVTGGTGAPSTPASPPPPDTDSPTSTS